jgi:hypothetical protein
MTKRPIEGCQSEHFQPDFHILSFSPVVEDFRSGGEIPAPDRKVKDQHYRSFGNISP